MDLNQSYRSFVLAVAQNPRIKQLVLSRGRNFAKRFVAGDTLDEAMAAVESLEKSGVHAIMDLLGEMVVTEAAAVEFKEQIVGLIRAYGDRTYPRYVSLKLTQLGLDLSEDLAVALMTEVLQAATEANCFVRIDMEDSPRIDATLRVYTRLRGAGFSNTGLVLQSYLFRSEQDLKDLLPYRPALRIVKGAYKEDPSVAFQSKKLIDTQYLLLCKKAIEHGLPTAIATHDPQIIAEMKRWCQQMGVARDQFEFQLLYGIRRDEQKRLATEGYTVRAYVPYGTDWYPYFSRRIAERPENLFFVARSLVQG